MSTPVPVMKDFFISYNQNDRAWAEWIAWQLEDEGYSTILQAWDFRPGNNFVLKMQEATGANQTIPVFSPHFLAAEFTQPEWAQAFADDPRGEGRKIMPVRVQKCEPKGLLHPIIYIDLVGRYGDDARRELLNGVHPGRNKPPQAPPFPGDGGDGGAPKGPRFPDRGPRHINGGVMPPLVRDFTGRGEQLHMLRELLLSGKTAALTALHGKGGIGKTQIARKYVSLFENTYDVVWWIRAEEPATLAADYAALAVALGLAADEALQPEKIQLLSNWLDHSSGWLLIFDNAPHPESISAYLPNDPKGHVIITSRDQQWEEFAEPLPVEEWKPEESVAYILARTKSTDEGGAANLARELSNLPLALAQAVGYIIRTQTGFATYIELFRNRRAELEKEEKPPRGYLRTVTATYTLALDGLRNENPLAAELINLFAFMAPEAIPDYLLTEGAAKLPESLQSTVSDPIRFNRIKEAYRQCSLVDVEPGSFSVHRVVQKVARERLDDEAKLKWLDTAIVVMSEVFKWDLYDIERWSRHRQLLPHALAVLDWSRTLGRDTVDASILMTNVGLFCKGQGDYKMARTILEWALILDEKALGPEHITVAIDLNNLGNVYGNLGEYALARQALERALAIDEKALGPEHLTVAVRLSNLGNVYGDLGEYTLARQVLERALAISEKALGSEHPTVGTRLSNLGIIYRHLGELTLARQALERALSNSESVLGPEHPIVATRLSNLGNVYGNLGEYALAQQVLERALAIDEKALGPEHPIVATRLNNLGNVYRDLGEHALARQVLERALAISEKVLGPEHPSVAIALSNLGIVYKNLREYSLARRALNRALAIDEKRLGVEHPYVATDLNNLASIFLAEGKTEEARLFFERALRILRKTFDDYHPDVRIIQCWIDSLDETK